MADKLIFLSHIHEEKALAIMIKEALENEFSGFVDVFVSSDGVSIPAGSNFLRKIEEGLVSCVGAIYLISPTSVKRNWVNFELGAVWVRNVMSQRAGGPEVPTLPMCHSGITPITLPPPLNNLNAVIANQASQLEFAFQSLQTAVGGGGALKTDFDALAATINRLEVGYMLGSNLKEMLALISGGDFRQVVEHCKSLPSNANTTLHCGAVENSIIQSLRAFEANQLKGKVTISIENIGTFAGPMGMFNGAEVKITLPVSLVLKFQQLLLA